MKTLLLITISLVLLAPSAVHAGLRILEDQHISISASSDIGDRESLSSGVYVAYSNQGRIDFIAPGESNLDSYNGLHRFSRLNSLEFLRPTVIAEENGHLYVWDAEYHALVAVDLQTGTRRILTRDNRIEDPAQIVVSPDNDLLIFDRRGAGVFWLKDTGGTNTAVREARELSNLVAPKSSTFLSWDKLAVLDGAANSVLLYHIDFSEEKIHIKPLPNLPLEQRKVAGDFTAITSQDGTLYVADSKRVYTYVLDTRELVAAIPEGVFSDIREIAASREHLFVLDGEELKPIPKTIAVEIEFGAQAADSQAALVQLYMYLDRASLLPTRRIHSARNYDYLSEFLADKGVLLTTHNVALEKTKSWFFIGEKYKARSEVMNPQQEFGYWLCRKNPTLCRKTGSTNRLAEPLAENISIRVPGIEVRSGLSRRKVALENATVEEKLEKSIVSPEQRERISYKLLQRFNKFAKELSEKDFYKRRRGDVILPYEKWSITVNVPAGDYYNRNSELFRIIADPDINLYGLEVYTNQRASSHHDPSGGSATCHKIREVNLKLQEAINYPTRLFTQDDEVGLEDFAGEIGIVENANHVTRDHMIFVADSQPAWFTPVDFDLMPDAVPLSLDNDQAGLGQFAPSHHGTHVAALIGGRKGQCWSGLLPSSQLVLADASGDIVRRNILKARNAGVQIFNVSQQLGGKGFNSPQADDRLKTFFTDDTADVLYIVAAGQAGKGGTGKNLNNVIAESYPAAWGDFGNIVTVTSVFQEAHYGKKYVDLITEGEEILSATERNFFATTTGTSQSAPLVTAAAAYLIGAEGGNQSPGDVKARLLATARWADAFTGKAWGGELDFADAVRFHAKSVFKTHLDSHDEAYAMVIPRDRNRLTVTNFSDARYYPRAGSADLLAENFSIRQENIISLRKNSDGVSHRLVYRDKASKQLKIVLNAQLEGTLKFKGTMKFNFKQRKFVRNSADELFHKNGIDVAQIEEYFAKMPYHINW